MKRLFSVLIVLAIVLSLIPMSVFANEAETSAPAETAPAVAAPAETAPAASEPTAAEQTPAQPAEKTEAGTETTPASENQPAEKTETEQGTEAKTEETKTSETTTDGAKTEESKSEEKQEVEDPTYSVAGHADHCSCGGADLGACTTHTCETITSWTAVNQSNCGNYWKATNLTTTVNLVLTENISVTKGLYLADGGVLNLCLNGYTIYVGNGRRAFNVYQGGTLNVCDCVGTGKIVTTSACSTGAIISSNGSGKTQPRVINLYGGEFTTTATNITCPAINMQYGYTTVNFFDKVKFSNWVNNTSATGNSDLGGVIAMHTSTNSFNMYGGTITGCKMTNTNNGNGGAIYCAGSATANMYGGLIENCSATNGGAVFVASGKFNMVGGTISGCTATKNGGAVYVNTNSTGSFNFEAGTIEKCSAQIGGAVSLTKNGEMTMSNGATISECKTVDGTVSGNGHAGAILVNTNAKSLKITDSSFSKNEGKNGGAIAYLGGTLELDNVSFTDNKASTYGGALYCSGAALEPKVNNCTMTGNTAGTYGGAVYLNNTKEAKFTDCTISENTAPTGGAVYLNNANQKAEFTDCTMSKNSATTGGAIYDNKSTLTISGGSYSENVATTTFGGVLNGQAANITVKDATFTNNTATLKHGGFAYIKDSTINISDCTFDGNTAAEYGGAFFQYSGTSKIENSIFKNNSVQKTGGAITGSNGQMDIINCQFLNNYARSGGGAIITTTNNSGHITDCTFDGNSAGGYNNGKYIESNGGALNLAGLTLDGTNVFKNNHTTGYGGALSIGSPMTLSNLIFENNSASIRGGALMFSKSAKVATLVNCSFYNNVAKNDASYLNGQAGGGGAICSNAKLIVNGGEFVGNAADNHGGGAILVNSADLQVSGVTFKNNTANMDTGYGACGGGAILFNSGWYSYNKIHDCVIRDCLFEANESAGYGGGVNVRHGNVTLENNTFNYNLGMYGGGYCCGGFTYNKVRNNTFLGNEATKMGGGYLVQADCTLDMSDCSFTGNFADGGGAGMCIYNVEGATVRNILCVNNRAKTSGGGIYALSRYKGGVIENVTAYNNYTAASGAGIYTSGEWTINNADVHDNESVNTAGGIYGANASILTINNSHIYDNLTHGNGGAVASNGFVDVYNTVIENNHAEKDGGAFSMSGATGYFTYLKLHENTIVRNNFCDGNGGAAWVWRTYNLCEIDGAEVYGNKAAGDGGAFYQNDETRMNVISGKVYNNKAGGNGGAIFGQGEVNLLGGEIYGNTAANIGGGIYLTNVTADTESVQHNVFTLGPIKVYDNKAKIADGIYLGDTSGATVYNGVLTGGADFDLTIDEGRNLTKVMQGAYNYKNLGNNTFHISDASNALRPTEVDKNGIIHIIGEFLAVNKNGDKIEGSSQQKVTKELEYEEEETNMQEDQYSNLGETDVGVLGASALGVSLAAAVILLKKTWIAK